MSSARVRYVLGTMSFSHPDWAGVFYPRGVKPGDWLETYATAFDGVELDTTFHATPPPERFERWASVVPDHFRFTMKAPRTVTHEPPIDRNVSAMRHFVDSACHLGDKLAVVLLQFPPSFGASHVGRLTTFMQGLPGYARYAVEFRNRTWLETEIYPRVFDMLRANRAAWASADYDNDAVEPPHAPIVTTDFHYHRWVGQHDRFQTHVSEQIDMSERLKWWHEQFNALPPSVENLFGFFNNDYAGYSIETCNRFKSIVGQNEKAPYRKQGELFG